MKPDISGPSSGIGQGGSETQDDAWTGHHTSLLRRRDERDVDAQQENVHAKDQRDLPPCGRRPDGSRCAIARSLGASNSTVADAIARLKAARLTWEQVETMSEAELELAERFLGDRRVRIHE